MASQFQELTGALIAYLEQLKSNGVQYVGVSPELLRQLQEPLGAPRAQGVPRAPVRVAPEPIVDRAEAREAERVALGTAVSGSAAQGTDSDDSVQNQMAALRERALLCQKCQHLARSRKNVVFGVGNLHAELMFVGEAPGADEDAQGEPFVGNAGQLLTRIIQTMGLSRETVYIANVLKCRPDTPGQAFGNRKPTAEEMKTCLPYLLAQIELIRPKVIVALGATAMEGLFGRTVAITKERGRFQDFRGIPVMPTYHPSYLLRSETLTPKRQLWEDMLQVLQHLQLPISEKQRNYFLKPRQEP